jgi:hypothetical protein
MRPKVMMPLLFVGSFALVAAHAAAQDTPPPTVQIPKPGVPQIMTMDGRFVRAAYNNEGYVILGYEVAQRSIGEKWILLEVGITVMDKVPDYKLTRDKISLDTPDGKHIPLPTQSEYMGADLRAMQMRSKVQRDSINYFPPSAHMACRIGFFADLDKRGLSWDEVEISDERACLGRLYFPLPAGIAYGQYWLNVQFANSLVRVPFRIFTEDEEKMLSKNYKAISQQVKEAFKPKKKS